MSLRAMLVRASIPLALFGATAGCGNARAEPSKGVSPQVVADAIQTVVAADRAVYVREVINRLYEEEKVIQASEHFRDDKALPLPAQMLRFGAEQALKQGKGFSYALVSPWPINKQNGPKTEAEKVGVPQVTKTGENYYTEETLGGKRYFTAMYPDKATAAGCARCHNEHDDSPKKDFKLGDVMGALVVRVPIDR